MRRSPPRGPRFPLLLSASVLLSLLVLAGCVGAKGEAGRRDLGAGPGTGADGGRTGEGEGDREDAGERDGGAGDASEVGPGALADAGDAVGRDSADDGPGPGREPAGLVACWPLDEGSGEVAHDTSAHGNDGLVEGAVWAGGRCGRGLRFGGSADVKIPDTALLRPETTHSFTWMSWIELLSMPLFVPGEFPLPRIMDKAWCYSAIAGDWSPLGCPTPCFEIGAGDNDLEFWPQRDLYGDGSACLSEGQWAHLAFVFDGAGRSMAIFLDGRRLETEVITGGPAPEASWGFGTAGSDLFLGRGGLDAVLDEVRIYDRALADEEVRALADEGCSR